MTVLVVLGSLAVLLALACWWESRSGRPAWGAHLREVPSPTPAAGTTAAAAAAAAALAALDGGDG